MLGQWLRTIFTEDGTLQLDLRDLRRAINVALDHIIEARGVETVEIAQPFYWNVPQDTRYDVAQDPPDLDVGSLADEWDFCANLLDGSAPPVALQLDELAPILQYVGVVLGERLAGQGG